MIIYTNLSNEHILFIRLTNILADFNINLRCGVIENNTDLLIKHEIVIFWFAKSNNTKLHYYRIKESVENIYNSLRVLENHAELIK